MKGNPLPLSELLVCLKKIQKSIQFHTKQGGRKGYIAFVTPYAFPEKKDSSLPPNTLSHKSKLGGNFSQF